MSWSVGIIGASGAGIYASLFISKRFPDASISLFDQKKTIGKKLLATGNGHCNILPQNLSPNVYRHPDWFKELLGKLNLDDLKAILLEEGVSLKEVGGLYYPECYHAPTYVDFLYEKLRKSKIKLSLDCKVLDYKRSGNQYELKTSTGNYRFDKLIFAFGGCSQPNLGSDGSLFGILNNHGYKLAPLTPGLAPIITKESTKRLSGIRHDARICLKSGGQVLYEEKGEVIFKKDGLSGICVMNAESIWAREGFPSAEIDIDLFPNESLEELSSRLEQLRKSEPSIYLDAIFVKDLKEYLQQGAMRVYGNQNPDSIAKVAKKLTFHLKESYGFADSQVTIGGVLKENLDENLQSVLEDSVYFIGECLDNDSLCGGNNLAWCLLTALRVKEAL